MSDSIALYGFTDPVVRQHAAATDAQRNAQLLQRCQEFEAVLVNTMMQSMRQTVPSDGLFHGGHAEQMYTSMLDMEYARQMSIESRSSLARTMYERLQPQERPGVWGPSQIQDVPVVRQALRVTG